MDSLSCSATLFDNAGLILILIQMNDGRRIASSDYDGSIKIWNTETLSCEQILVHDSCIQAVLQLKDGRLLSFYESSGIKLWNPDTGALDQEITMSDSSMIIHATQLSNGGLFISYLSGKLPERKNCRDRSHHLVLVDH